MGAAASNSPPVGVALNPRVEYASKLAQAEGKILLRIGLLPYKGFVQCGRHCYPDRFFLNGCDTYDELVLMKPMLYQPVSAVSFKPATLLHAGEKLVVTDEQDWVAHKPFMSWTPISGYTKMHTCTWRDAYDNIVASVDTELHFHKHLCSMRCLQSHLIDAPVLVDLPQGSIRYRFVDRRTQTNAGLPTSNLSLQSSDIPDGPHRGCNDLQHKKGYFFQAKLADYSTEANKSHPAAEYKFKYVYNGPRCAKNKRLFYVTGTGLPVDHESLSSDLNTPTWPNIATENNHVYYSLHFLSDDADIDEEESEKINSNAPILMKLNADDSIEALKENVSMHILKPTTQIHIFYQQHEIRPETEVNGLRGEHTTLAELKVRLIKLK